jgi:hypothetical protein
MKLCIGTEGVSLYFLLILFADEIAGVMAINSLDFRGGIS